MIYAVSSCLLGKNCKYNGGNNFDERVIKLCEENSFIEICPETFGGLKAPREPAEIEDGSGEDVLSGKAKVKSRTGQDLTEEFIKGAYASLDKIKKAVSDGEEVIAVLKARSPSCGCGTIYDGTFGGKRIKGNGVAAALLLREGIKVCTEDDIKDDIEDDIKE